MSKTSRTSKSKAPSQSQPLPWYRRLWLQSQTKLLAYTQGSTAILLGSVDLVHELVTNADVRASLEPIHAPAWLPLLLASIGVLTYMAHGHKDDA